MGYAYGPPLASQHCSCEAGYEMDAANQVCVACPWGTFKHSAGNDETCVPCAYFANQQQQQQQQQQSNTVNGTGGSGGNDGNAGGNTGSSGTTAATECPTAQDTEPAELCDSYYVYGAGEQWGGMWMRVVSLDGDAHPTGMVRYVQQQQQPLSGAAYSSSYYNSSAAPGGGAVLSHLYGSGVWTLAASTAAALAAAYSNGRECSPSTCLVVDRGQPPQAWTSWFGMAGSGVECPCSATRQPWQTGGSSGGGGSGSGASVGQQTQQPQQINSGYCTNSSGSNNSSTGSNSGGSGNADGYDGKQSDPFYGSNACTCPVGQGSDPASGLCTDCPVGSYWRVSVGVIS